MAAGSRCARVLERRGSAVARQRRNAKGILQARREYLTNVLAPGNAVWSGRIKTDSGAVVAIPSETVSAALLTMRPTLGLVVKEKYRVEIPDAFSPATLEAVLQVLNRL